jgi:DNA-3-methyladenine glycosylase
LWDLTRGPGRLASALRIDRQVDGVDMCDHGPLWLGALSLSTNPLRGEKSLARRLGSSPRIGITRAADRLLRFYERGSRFVSGSALHRA